MFGKHCMVWRCDGYMLGVFGESNTNHWIWSCVQLMFSVCWWMLDNMHNQVMHSQTSTHGNPRLCLEDKAEQCTWFQWFGHADGTVYYPHIKCRNIPANTHQEVMRSARVGCWCVWVLCGCVWVWSGQLLLCGWASQTPQPQRICPCCLSGQTEINCTWFYVCCRPLDLIWKHLSWFIIIRGHDMVTLAWSQLHLSRLANLIHSKCMKQEQLVDVDCVGFCIRLFACCGC